MNREKKIYLKRYLLQESKISRFNQMKILDPKREKLYQQKISIAKTIRKEIENKIETVDDDLLKEILYNKYILGKTLEEISLVINYSKRHVERLHIKALEKIII